jgi:hypothetical protein
MLCCCIFVPEAARLIAGSFCAYTVINEDANPVCACQFNSVPFEMQQTSFPDRHKELMQQTEWQYLNNVFPGYYAPYISDCSNKHPELEVQIDSSFTGNIFHPPCIS